MCWQQAHSLDHQTSIAIKRRWCRPSVILRFFFLWRYFEKMIQMAILNLRCDSGCRKRAGCRYFEKMIQMAILNLRCDSGCRKRAGCRTCILSRGSRAVLTFTLFAFFLLEAKVCCCRAAEHRHNSSWDSWRTSCCLRISNCEYCFYGALQKFSSKSCRWFCFLEFWGIYIVIDGVLCCPKIWGFK